MKKIEGSPKSLKQLLQNTKYSIHYYQREYMWQRKHIEELIDDLTSEFLDFYVPGDNRQKVQDYGVNCPCRKRECHHRRTAEVFFAYSVIDVS